VLATKRVFGVRRPSLLIATAVIEVGAGLTFLLLPAVVFDFLIGISGPAAEALFVGRVAGAALLALGVVSWLDRHGPATSGLIAGVLVYNATVAVLLVYAGLGLDMAGMVHWPAVVLHIAMSGCCVRRLLAAGANRVHNE
jgi:hypothetical protein